MAYLPVTEEAAALEAVVAERYPEMAEADRGLFASSVLRKVTWMLRNGDHVELHAVDNRGADTGGRSALVLRGEA
jgi:hypothetical protein